MGLIKAAVGAVGGVLADQWKEFFYCDSLNENILMAKGQKQTSRHGRSGNTDGEDNIISNGSRIAVNNGQCMLIVESGKVSKSAPNRANIRMMRRRKRPFSMATMPATWASPSACSSAR